MEGIIVKSISNDWTIKHNNEYYVCKASGKIRYNGLTPMVGDNVTFNEIDKYITSIHKRKNVLNRPPVSNIDQAIIATSVKDPDFNTNLLDKFLTIISFNNITPIICLTKLDLLNEIELNELNKIIKYYEKIGYKVIKNSDINELKNILSNKLTVLTGQSGVGKSTLINTLDKNLNLLTGETSKALGRGKHTTRHVELYPIYGGLIVDTPGFSSLDINELTNIEIRDNMKEMFENIDLCKYKDCMHIKEDNCEVKRRVENNEILLSRYENYKTFINKK